MAAVGPTDEAAYLRHLLTHVVVPGAHPTIDLLARLTTLGFIAESHRDAIDPIKQRRTRIAVLRAR